MLLITTRGVEDLRIFKLFLYLFEGISRLSINFHKSCLYYAKYYELPDSTCIYTLNCVTNRLLVTYLGISISRRSPRRQDQLRLTCMIRARLTSWKLRYISTGDRLALINSILSTIPTYWMSVFELPKWVIHDIDKIRRDFLWNTKESAHSKCRLVVQPQVCKTKNQKGWGVLNLRDFNYALLGKWWWKLSKNSFFCQSPVISFNYNRLSRLELLFHTSPHKIVLLDSHS